MEIKHLTVQVVRATSACGCTAEVKYEKLPATATAENTEIRFCAQHAADSNRSVRQEMMMEFLDGELKRLPTRPAIQRGAPTVTVTDPNAKREPTIAEKVAAARAQARKDPDGTRSSGVTAADAAPKERVPRDPTRVATLGGSGSPLQRSSTAIPQRQPSAASAGASAAIDGELADL